MKILGKLALAAILAASFCCVHGCEPLEDSSMEHTYNTK